MSMMAGVLCAVYMLVTPTGGDLFSYRLVILDLIGQFLESLLNLMGKFLKTWLKRCFFIFLLFEIFPID